MVSWRCVSAALELGRALGRVRPADRSHRRPAGSRLFIDPEPCHGVPSRTRESPRGCCSGRIDARMTPVSRLDAQALHQPRCVHMSVTNADAAVRHGFGDECGRDVGKVESKKWERVRRGVQGRQCRRRWRRQPCSTSSISQESVASYSRMEVMARTRESRRDAGSAFFLFAAVALAESFRDRRQRLPCRQHSR